MGEAEIKELLNIINVEYLSQNPNDVAVEYFIYNPRLLKHSKFSLNTNSKAVTYLINNPQFIDYELFALNSNELAICWKLINLFAQ